MVYRKKGQFVLDIEHLQRIVDDVLRQPSNSDVKIEIHKSPNKKSKSLYIKIFIGEYSTVLRVSDHKCKGQVRAIIVSESTGNDNLYGKIEGAIKDLRYKKLQGVLGTL